MSVKYHQRTEDAHQLIPPRGYTDARYFELEQDLLFGRTWMYAGMVDDVLQPGDYLTVQAGRFPLAIVRGQDDKLRASTISVDIEEHSFWKGVAILSAVSSVPIISGSMN